MSNIYLMGDDKSLCNTVSSTIYAGEKNSDSVTILLPEKYEGENLRGCRMTLHFPDQKVEKNIQPCIELYRGYLVYNYKLGLEVTAKAGRYPLYVDVKRVGYTLMTGTAYLTVLGVSK